MKRDAGMVNAFVEGAASLDDATAAMIAQRKKLLGPAYRLFYQRPVHFVRGEGAWLYDTAGDAYLDAYNNVTSIGHCHPKVVDAVSHQMATLSTHTRYLHDAVLRYADRLLSTMPAEIGHLMFTCTGSEANDLAVRIAEAHTGRQGIIVTETAYHGVTQAVARFSPSLGENVPLGIQVRTVPAPDAYRSPTGDVGAEFTRAVQAAIRDLQRHGIEPALFICDGIFASDGVFDGPPGFLKGAVEAIRAAGGLYIADEVQSGFGRTGDRMWGFQRHGVVPDLVTMGKPMGNGYPVAGVAGRPDVLAKFGQESRYFNTFGGNAVAAAAATAVLDVIENDGLVENSRVMGDYLKTGFRHLADKHPAIGDIRGAGMFLGVEIVSDRGAKTPDAAKTTAIVNALRDERVLISACAKSANILKIRPQIRSTRAELDVLIDKLDLVLGRSNEAANPSH